MAPIRKGDGTPIVPKGIQQVRTGDGRVLFEGTAIPDSGMDHFYWGPAIEDISTWPDEEGSEDASAVGSPSTGPINGAQSASYDGVNDWHQTANAFPFGTDDVYTFAGVFEVIDGNETHTIGGTGTDSNGASFRVNFNANEYDIRHPGVAVVGGGTPDENPHVFVATYDGSNIIIDIDGAQVVNSSIGSPASPTSEATVGSDAGINLTTGLVGAFGYEASFAGSARRDELTELLADPFGITTST